MIRDTPEDGGGMDDLKALQTLAEPGVARDKASSDAKAHEKAREEAARHLYFQWGNRLLAHFTLNGAPGSHAEDVLQEAIEKVFRKAHTFHGETPASAAAWIWTVAKNTLDDYRDQLKRQATHGATDLENPEVENPEPTVRRALLPEQQAWLAKAQECVRGSLLRFSRRHRRDAQALWMQAEGYSVAEIAARLGKTPNSTAVFLTGCRDRIDPWLEECRRYISGLAT
jgi:RNA polymerase sigma factor (sigma-70 family)